MRSGSMNYTAIRAYLRENLSYERYLHSELASSLAATLCIRFGFDEERGFFAGLAHDVARELPVAEILSLIRNGGEFPTEEEVRFPLLAHGRAGAMILKDRFGISDPDILEAVRCHTLGKAGMGKLAKIVFCADFLENGRPDVSGKMREEALRLDLDEMTVFIIERTIGYLLSKGRLPSKESIELYNELTGNPR